MTGVCVHGASYQAVSCVLPLLERIKRMLVRCSVLQCVAVRCSVLQCVAVWRLHGPRGQAAGCMLSLLVRKVG